MGFGGTFTRTCESREHGLRAVAGVGWSKTGTCGFMVLRLRARQKGEGEGSMPTKKFTLIGYLKSDHGREAAQLRSPFV